MKMNKYRAEFNGDNYMNGVIIECVSPDVRTLHDIVKREMRSAAHDGDNIEAFIYKNDEYFAQAWGKSFGAGAIGFSGSVEKRSLECW